MKAILLALVLVALAASPGFAQTPTTALWTAPSDAATAAVAQGLTYTLYVNNGVGQVLASVVCAGTPILCQAPLPAGLPGVLDTKFELTAKTATSGESPRSIPFIQPPGAPTAVRIR